jgi:hypothetical protein
MLPGREHFNLLELKEISLSELVYDDNFYYTRSSSEGILHLICDHFSSIGGDEATQIARTSIGTFTFSSIEFGRTVRFNGRERYPQTFARPPQGFQAIRNYARGLFQRREGANLRYVQGSESELPPIWERHRIGQAIMHPDLVHTESLRFMTAEDIRELKFLHEVSSRILESVLSLMDSRSGDYESMKDDFEIVRILRSKPLSSPSALPVVVGAAKYALDGALSNAYPKNAGNENRMEQVAELIVQSDDLYNQLESELRAPENSVGFGHRFTTAADRNLNLIALLAAPAIIRKCNTGIILQYAIEAPENWIHLLAMENFDILLS